MAELKYKVIRNKTHYKDYCKKLEDFSLINKLFLKKKIVDTVSQFVIAPIKFNLAIRYYRIRLVIMVPIIVITTKPTPT